MLTIRRTAAMAVFIALAAAVTPLTANAVGPNGSAGFSPSPVGPPTGSYLHSCRNESLSDNRLSASCRNNSGRFQLTALTLSNCVDGSDISNNNGQLQCSKR
jgi:hypothetical protein